MNNHYVPRLVLRRFNEKVSTYNIKEKNLRQNLKLEKVFCDDGIYTDELESDLNIKLESRFANLLTNNILAAKDKIYLKRPEVRLIKKFLMIEQIRTPDNIDYLKKIKTKDIDKEYKSYGFKEVLIENESLEEYRERTINVILESESLEDVLNNPKVTFEACKWWSLYESCYLVFWDSKDVNEDFIITDEGMACEHEASKFLIKGNDDELLKAGYMMFCIETSKTTNERLQYLNLLNGMRFVHANFYMFSISSTRMIGLVNPFFRLFDATEIDAVWHNEPPYNPSKMPLEAFPKNKYYQKRKKKSEDDLYVYSIVNLDVYMAIYINTLMLDRVDNLVGFANLENVRRSLYVYSFIKGLRNYDYLIEKLNINDETIENSDKLKQFSNIVKFTQEDVDDVVNNPFVKIAYTFLQSKLK